MSDPQTKGFNIKSNMDAIQEELTDAEQEAFLQHLPPDMMAQLSDVSAGSWYPIEWINAIFDGLVAAKGADTPEEAWKVVEEFSAGVAAKNFNSVLKLMVRFMKPQTLAKMLPKFWDKYYRDAGSVRFVSSDLDNRTVEVELLDHPHVQRIAATISGWILAAFQKTGVQDIQVEELNYGVGDQRGDQYRFKISWS